MTNESNVPLAPNKSSLFGGAMKPVPNHGKPNCAPKPPGIQQLMTSKNIVSRHHSMRSPRSPPISTANGPIFPNAQHFGTMRGAPQQFQSQDSINTTTRQAPNPPISRPTVAPPRPPNIKPPPPPIRSISNTNLTTLPLSLPPSSAGFGSATNVSSLKDQFANKTQIGAANSANNVSTLHNNISSSNQSIAAKPSTVSVNNFNNTKNSNGSNNSLPNSKEVSPNGSAPPLPPHRTCPAPPPPMRQASNTANNTSLSTNSGAPPVPLRHSSMNRASNTSVSPHNSQPNNHNNSGSRDSNKMVIDIEAKFGHLFHNVTEFPSPPPFTNVPKTYPSRSNKTATG